MLINIMKHKTYNRNGFTILEVVLAISVLTLAVGGSFSLLQQTLHIASMANSKLTATYLAQEGIEIVRNIRDNNWLKQRMTSDFSWKDGLGSSDPYEADYSDPALRPFSGEPLSFDDTNGLYSYPTWGTETKFKRKIIIADMGNYLDVTVRVEWPGRVGEIKNVELKEYLYNWGGNENYEE
jgi:type II secretory pathway pseudopilin PulG